MFDGTYRHLLGAAKARDDAQALLAPPSSSPAPLLSSLQDFVSESMERERHACDAEPIFPPPHNRIMEPKRATSVVPRDGKSEGRGAQIFSGHLDLRGTLYRARLDRNFLSEK